MNKYFSADQVAFQYDKYISKNIPFYWDAVKFISSSLAESCKSRKDICAIELGPGTGNLTLEVFRNLSMKDYLLVDSSKPMLEIAEKKLKSNIKEKKYNLFTSHSDFSQFNWLNIEGFPYQNLNAIISLLALDHIQNNEQYQELLKKIYDILPSDGLFIFGEKCADGRNIESNSYRAFKNMIQIRESHLRKFRLKNERAIERWKYHVLSEDVLRPLSKMWGWLEEIGFSVIKAAGVPLKLNDSLTYKNFYRISKVVPLEKEQVLQNDIAYGVGILVCQKI